MADPNGSEEEEFKGFENDQEDDSSIYEDSFADEQARMLKELAGVGNSDGGNTRLNEEHDKTRWDDHKKSEGRSENVGQPSTDVITMLIEQGRRRDEMMERMMLQFAQLQVGRNAGEQRTNETGSAIPAYHIMPDLSKDIQTFDGEKETVSAKECLRNLESRKMLHQWPESFTLETAQSHLRGGARHWLAHKELLTWESFKSAFSIGLLALIVLRIDGKECQIEFSLEENQ